VADPSDPKRRGRDEEEGLSNLASAYRKAAPYMAASTQLVVSVGLLAGLGYWADQKLGHTVPWLLLVGAAVGMTAGFISFFRIVLGQDKK
jgi:F0F1-type ATP synthase assembly protein I